MSWVGEIGFSKFGGRRRNISRVVESYELNIGEGIIHNLEDG